MLLVLSRLVFSASTDFYSFDLGKPLLSLSPFQSLFHGVFVAAHHALGSIDTFIPRSPSMTLFPFPLRSPKVRFSLLPAADFHSHSFGGPHCPPAQFLHRPEDLNRPNPSHLWFAKVLSTLFIVKSHCLDAFASYLSQSVTPVTAYEAVTRIKDPDLAFGLFEFNREKLNLKHSFRTYDYLLRFFCQLGVLGLADSVLGYMRTDGFFPDSQLLGILVSSLIESCVHENVRKLLAETECQEVGVDAFVYNKYLNVLVRENKVDEAIVFFKKCMSTNSHSCLDTCTFNILIRGLCRVRKLDEAFRFLYSMENFDCFPDIITYNTLVDGLCKANEVKRGHGLLKEVQGKDYVSPDVKTYTAVISGYCKTSRMDEASTLFHEMTAAGIRPTLFTFNVLIDGFGKLGDMASALVIFEKMLLMGCSPDVVTFSSLIDGYCRSGQVDDGLKLWKKMISRNLYPNEYTFSIMINALCKQNRLIEARDFLLELKWRNIVSWPFMYNPVIDGLCKAGNLEEARLVVAEMEERRCKPDKITFTILIIGHCMKGRMLEAIDFFNRMFIVKCIPDTITVNCLVSCLLKAGMAMEAMQIIKQVAEEKIIVSSSSSCRSIPSSTRLDIPVAV